MALPNSVLPPVLEDVLVLPVAGVFEPKRLPALPPLNGVAVAVLLPRLPKLQLPPAFALPPADVVGVF